MRRDAVVLLIENDADVRDATLRLLRGWSCRAVPRAAGRHHRSWKAWTVRRISSSPTTISTRAKQGFPPCGELRRLAGARHPRGGHHRGPQQRNHRRYSGGRMRADAQAIKPAELRALMTHLLTQRRARWPSQALATSPPRIASKSSLPFSMTASVRLDVELAQDLRDMRLHRGLYDAELVRDLPVQSPVPDQLQNADPAPALAPPGALHIARLRLG